MSSCKLTFETESIGARAMKRPREEDILFVIKLTNKRSMICEI
jgi:hypothetical protein